MIKTINVCNICFEPVNDNTEGTVFAHDGHVDHDVFQREFDQVSPKDVCLCNSCIDGLKRTGAFK